MRRTDGPSVLLQFSKTGYLRKVLINANDDKEQEAVEKNLNRILDGGVGHWFWRLWGKCRP